MIKYKYNKKNLLWNNLNYSFKDKNISTNKLILKKDKKLNKSQKIKVNNENNDIFKNYKFYVIKNKIDNFYKESKKLLKNEFTFQLPSNPLISKDKFPKKKKFYNQLIKNEKYKVIYDTIFFSWFKDKTKIEDLFKTKNKNIKIDKKILEFNYCKLLKLIDIQNSLYNKFLKNIKLNKTIKRNNNSILEEIKVDENDNIYEDKINKYNKYDIKNSEIEIKLKNRIDLIITILIKNLKNKNKLPTKSIENYWEEKQKFYNYNISREELVNYIIEKEIQNITNKDYFYYKNFEIEENLYNEKYDYYSHFKNYFIPDYNFNHKSINLGNSILKKNNRSSKFKISKLINNNNTISNKKFKVKNNNKFNVSKVHSNLNEYKYIIEESKSKLNKYKIIKNSININKKPKQMSRIISDLKDIHLKYSNKIL